MQLAAVLLIGILFVLTAYVAVYWPVLPAVLFGLVSGILFVALLAWLDKVGL